MFKFVAIIACFASLVCAVPLESKPEGSTDNASKKVNLTEITGSDPKAVPSYSYNENYLVNRRPLPFYSVQAASKPVFSSPLIRPSISLPSSYQGLFSDVRTTHLRPQLYQAQPQLYTYPIQSYQSYPQSYSYSSSYPSPQSYYGNYGYSGYYKEAKEQQEPEMAMQSAPATRILIEKPVATQQVNQMPVSQDQQVPNMISRDASSYWSPVSYTALPQDNFGQIEDIRKRDILIDDKYNMQIQPSYLMDRLHLQSNTPTYKSGRSAEDFSSSEFGPAASPEDDVYVIMNKYDQHPVAAKAALDEAFQPIGNAQMNSIWMPPVFNSPVTANLRDGGNLPYSHENILSSMNQFYANEYMKEMAHANQHLSQKPERSSQSEEEKLVQALAQEILNKMKAASSKKTEPSQPVKTEEKKETSTSAPKTN